MKKTNMLNAPLSAVIAELGHTDSLCIADAGLPIPMASERIDLALRPGTPAFLEVLATVLEEQVVERALAAEEIKTKNPEVLKGIKSLLGDVPLEFVTHDEFKQKSAESRAVVRTGECSPYANIILYSGVAF